MPQWLRNLRDEHLLGCNYLVVVQSEDSLSWDGEDNGDSGGQGGNSLAACDMRDMETRISHLISDKFTRLAAELKASGAQQGELLAPRSSWAKDGWPLAVPAQRGASSSTAAYYAQQQKMVDMAMTTGNSGYGYGGNSGYGGMMGTPARPPRVPRAAGNSDGDPSAGDNGSSGQADAPGAGDGARPGGGSGGGGSQVGDEGSTSGSPVGDG
ncbi:hypothetical protein HYH03_014243 [Edaphochlamys debaryana]|uniref:Uncharacterized protein n=1 Tax=Edaphochlamys debaryana TaxID=47281 RepID=A0A835XUH4_9CHLO|nr:hypothetical protein HYH03_014243 [Edaphochlamys debaryana]|eukprot:KAG2487130.1 hypothetical protein HYH03_014243 [Edaphochlamys debaryana]